MNSCDFFLTGYYILLLNHLNLPLPESTAGSSDLFRIKTSVFKDKYSERLNCKAQ